MLGQGLHYHTASTISRNLCMRADLRCCICCLYSYPEKQAHKKWSAISMTRRNLVLTQSVKTRTIPRSFLIYKGIEMLSLLCYFSWKRAKKRPNTSAGKTLDHGSSGETGALVCGTVNSPVGRPVLRSNSHSNKDVIGYAFLHGSRE